MSNRLEGKVALITGAARGQGAHEAALFAAEGARVMLADRLHDEARHASSFIPNAAACRLDVSEPAQWAKAVDQTLAQFGRLDILVNNAAILRKGAIEDTTAEAFMEVVRVNQLGVFLGMQAVLPAMKARGGSIVNISSAAGLQGAANLIAYTATKWAIRGMTKVAALELARHNIRVNSVHPGLIDTPMLQDGVGAERAAVLTQTVPLGRIGSTAEAANLVLFLASDESAYCTGGEFTADGGSTAGQRYQPDEDR